MKKPMQLVLLLTAMLAAGCSDATMAPTANTADPGDATDVVLPGGGATAALTSVDTLRFTFVIDPYRARSYDLGAGNAIVFPAGSVCDPNRSTYGNGEWDRPCTAATSSVTIQTKAWLDARGYAHVDFDRHVRFVPSSNPSRWVMLTLSDYGASLSPWATIKYCKDVKHDSKGNCEDEAKKDPSLATVRNPVTGKLTRRVKHFSGYSLTSGREDEGYEF